MGDFGPQGEALILELQRLRHEFDEEGEPKGRRQRAASSDRQRRGNSPKRRRKSKMGKAIDGWLQQIGLKAPIEQDARSGAAKREPGRQERGRGEPLRREQGRGEPVRGEAGGKPSRRKEPIVINKPEPSRATPLGRKEPPSRRPPVRPTPARREPPPFELVPPQAKRNSPPTVPDGDTPLDLMRPGPQIQTRRGPQQPSILLQGPPPALPGSSKDLPGPSKESSGSKQLVARPAAPAGNLITRCRAGLTAGFEFVAYHGAPAPPADGGLVLRTRWSFERELRAGLRILIVAAVLGGGWLVFVPLAGAVVVPGNLVVQSNVKQIQHPTGGVVAEIKAQNGVRVEAGDLLVRLDATQTQAGLEVITKQLDEARARIARLVAERDGAAQIAFPPELTSRSGAEDTKSLMASEESLFKARASSRQSQKDLLQSQMGQLTQQISGLDAQVDSHAKQLDLIQGELAGVQDLYDKRLVPLTRLTSLQRDAARIDGERGQLTSSIAETKSKIDASQLQIIRIDQDFRAEVVKDLNEAQAKEAELTQKGVAARDQLDRIEIRAPTSGTVNQLDVHTIGGVIKAGETIMEIVPDSDDLQIEARVDPKDIDHVKNGQKAFVRLTAFNQRTTPQLNGDVTYVSADVGKDQQQAGKTFYTIRVVLPEEERRRISGQQLVPGMPAEVYVQTGSRTMMSYLFEPISDQLRRAFVEN
ncbi:HlyD family type I secretion periplasmic adaptor subunit [Bradyrhizobium sp.]|uniref:HlyD family type I secretion periplasmic adaptor subunit n=1 Tax=Bradyrhizobium sp. TaxID=376 RepID=UPI0025BB40DD|nr:HlyD family type I secretion periplasmic adaptor subunit [Bradyrhizobium sp.]